MVVAKRVVCILSAVVLIAKLNLTDISRDRIISESPAPMTFNKLFRTHFSESSNTLLFPTLPPSLPSPALTTSMASIPVPTMADLQLPAKSPTQAFQGQCNVTHQVAVYTLVDLSDFGGITTLLKALEWMDLGGVLAPKYDFTDLALKNVYEYHLSLGESQRHITEPRPDETLYHPTLFIVASTQECSHRGVLVVNLDVDMECSIDVIREKVEDALQIPVNVKVGNMDWEDFKEQASFPPLETQDTSASELSADAQLVPTSNLSALSLAQEPVTPSPPPYTYAIYGLIKGVLLTKSQNQVEPGWGRKPRDTEFSKGVSVLPEGLTRVGNCHPSKCLQSPRLHRHWIICFDSLTPEEDGVLLVHLAWDSNVSRDDQMLWLVSAEVTHTERSSAGSVVEVLNARCQNE